MTVSKIEAISFSRCSSQKQSKGTTFERQYKSYFTVGTVQKNRASFEREERASWPGEGAVAVAARTGGSARRAVESAD